MSDEATTATPSPAPPAPTGPLPKVTNRGRSAAPAASANSETSDIPEYEYFIQPGPRGYPPLTGERGILWHVCVYVCDTVFENMHAFK